MRRHLLIFFLLFSISAFCKEYHIDSPHQDVITDAIVNNNTLLTTSRDGTAKLWSLPTLQLEDTISLPQLIPAKDKEKIEILSGNFLNKDEVILSVWSSIKDNDDFSLIVYNINQKKISKIIKLPDLGISTCVSPDAQYFAVVGLLGINVFSAKDFIEIPPEKERRKYENVFQCKFDKNNEFYYVGKISPKVSKLVSEKIDGDKTEIKNTKLLAFFSIPQFVIYDKLIIINGYIDEEEYPLSFLDKNNFKLVNKIEAPKLTSALSVQGDNLFFAGYDENSDKTSVKKSINIIKLDLNTEFIELLSNPGKYKYRIRLIDKNHNGLLVVSAKDIFFNID